MSVGPPGIDDQAELALPGLDDKKDSTPLLHIAIKEIDEEPRRNQPTDQGDVSMPRP